MLGSVIAGKYEILRVVGRGGMGEVFEARHGGLDRRVAIKVLHAEAFEDAAATERFLREARIAGRLASAHAVRVFDVDRLPSGRPYLVMELLEGEDLEQLGRRRPLTVAEALDYAIQATEALTEAHDLGLIHRDLKPHNLFLTKTADGAPCIKVVDFGLAKAISGTTVDEGVTRAGSIVGTPSFMSPEQIRRPEAMDLRSDLWSLGATLYMLLAGHPPFGATELEALLDQIVHAPPRPLREIRPEVPAEVARVVACALEKDVSRRYPDIRAMAQALRAAQTAVGVAPTMRDAGASPVLEGTTETTTPTSDAPKARPADPERVVAGRFRLLGTLGAGGMGDVFRAHDMVLDRSVALKVLRSDGAHDRDKRRRVVREARAAAALAHPNAVTIFDVGEDGEQVFIAMELVLGESLRTIIVRNDAKLEDRLRWLRDAGRALLAAHERGLVHRDVKPENMIVCRDGSLKLLDFGIAKRNAADDDTDSGAESVGPSSLETSTGRRVGTPRYMAPEQRLGTPTDARTDQYAWGLVAKELLGPDLATVPPALTAAIERAVQSEKDARHPTMAPILAAFDAKRRRGPALAIGLAVGALVLAGAGVAIAKWPHPKTVGPATAEKVFACTVTARDEFPLGAEERAGVDTEGAPLVARSLGHAPKLERWTADGWTRANPESQLYDLGNNRDDVLFTGTYDRAKPAMVAAFTQRGGRLVLVFTPTDIVSLMRISGTITGVFVTDFSGSNVTVSTSDRSTLDNSITSYGVTIASARNGEFAPVEGVAATNPTAASSRDHLAIAYTTKEGIRFVALDTFFVPVRPLVTITPVPAAPTITLEGKIATVLWSAPRLMRARVEIGPSVSVVTPIDAAPASEESAGPVLTAVELAGGRWGVAWTTPDKSALRFATLDATGKLGVAVDVARGGAFDDVRASHGRTDTPTFLWRDGERARTAKLACQTR